MTSSFYGDRVAAEKPRGIINYSVQYDIGQSVGGTLNVLYNEKEPISHCVSSNGWKKRKEKEKLGFCFKVLRWHYVDYEIKYKKKNLFSPTDLTQVRVLVLSVANQTTRVSQAQSVLSQAKQQRRGWLCDMTAVTLTLLSTLVWWINHIIWSIRHSRTKCLLTY